MMYSTNLTSRAVFFDRAGFVLLETLALSVEVGRKTQAWNADRWSGFGATQPVPGCSLSSTAHRS